VNVSGTITSREQAFEQLLAIAQFFKETEPQSPLIFAIEQVVRWGRTPLPNLLMELIPDDSVRKNLFTLVGIKEPASGSSSSE
jgi:type VI secretion system protein ImpA